MRAPAGWVALALLAAACAPPDRPGVLLVVIDTLRRDHLHCYGYPRRTSDAIDGLAARGWVFDEHVAHASQTVPSTLSLMLSRHPGDHGHVHRELGQFRRRRPRYADDLVFLAEVFREAGYATAAFVSNPFLSRESHYDQGFQTFEHWPGDQAGEGEFVASRAIAWLAGRPRAQPFFLYVHLMDVHMPYAQPEAFRRRFAPATDRRPLKGYGSGVAVSEEDLAATRAHYDAGVAFADHQVGRLVAALQAEGALDASIVAVTSDHGEEFLEHGGLGHGTTVYGELVRVPLVLVHPAALAPGRRIGHLSQHLDLAPTLLDLAGVPRPAEFRGGTLLAPAESVYAENGPWRAVYAEGHKLVLNLDTGETQLYSAEDRLDRAPLPASPVTDRLRERLDGYLALEQPEAPRPDGARPPWTEEDLERLRVLGYAE